MGRCEVWDFQEVSERQAPLSGMSLTTVEMPYTRPERELFELIPKDGTRISSARLANLRQIASNWAIDHQRNNVTTVMQSLIKKVNHNQENFQIKRTKRMGPHLAMYWIEAR